MPRQACYCKKKLQNRRIHATRSQRLVSCTKIHVLCLQPFQCEKFVFPHTLNQTRSMSEISLTGKRFRNFANYDNTLTCWVFWGVIFFICFVLFFLSLFFFTFLIPGTANQLLVTGQIIWSLTNPGFEPTTLQSLSYNKSTLFEPVTLTRSLM
jgi:hypothetical protein